MNTHKNAVTASKIPMIYTGNNLSMVLQGTPYTIAKGSPGFDSILEMIRSGSDEVTLKEFIDRDVKRLQEAAKALNSDVTIDVKGGLVTYNGKEIRNGLTKRMLVMLEEGFDLEPMKNFLKNLMNNPSMRAVSELYDFLEKGELPITPDGCFLAYKVVRSDFKDVHSGTMDNSVGRILTMPRNAVDDDKDRTCSHGLHFCSVEYLKHFYQPGYEVVILKINPCDVVSIPADYNNTKGRTCKYEVVGIFKDFNPKTPDNNIFTSSVYSNGNGVVQPYGAPSSNPTIG